jgi:hypothetical protein
MKHVLPGPSPGRQTSLKNFYASDKITLTMTAESFVDGIVWMVAKDGVPLRHFGQGGSRRLLGEMAQKVGVSLERNRVRDYVISAYMQLKQSVKEELKNKFVYLKFDTATRDLK